MRIDLSNDEPVEISMAPLIDCVFLLLIFFLVATTLKKIEKELPIELPQAAASLSTQVEDRMLIVGVDKMGAVYLNAERVSTETLHRRLKEAALANPNQRIRIDGDRSAPFQYIVRILDLCQFEGLKNVGVHTRK